MSDARRSQSRAVLAFVAVAISVGAGFGACTSYQRANGESCLKDIDCISGYCLAQKCDNPSPSLAGTSYGAVDAGATNPGTGQDSSTSTPDSAPVPDSAAPADTGPAPVDSGQDAFNGLRDSKIDRLHPSARIGRTLPV